MTLDPAQQRVLGALIEKEVATPEAYPLSLNALLSACNQRSSREPVMDLDEDQVRQALHALEAGGLATPVRDARVPKYEHRARTVLNLRRDETAVLCLLLLRGPQTPGELRARADRLFPFDGLDAVQSTLNRLAVRPAGHPARHPEAHPEAPAIEAPAAGPLVAMLPRQPGARESRYAHLLGDHPASPPPMIPSPASTSAPPSSRLAELEATVEALRAQLTALELRIARLEDRAP